MQMHLILLAAIGCSGKQPAPSAHTDPLPSAGQNRLAVADRLGPATPAEQHTTVRPVQTKYIASFTSSQEAERHAADIAKEGGSTHPIGADGHILVVTASSASLNDVSVPSDTLVMREARWTAQKPRAASLSGSERFDFAENLLTARNETGVAALVDRFPMADGRGVNVAVLDTGIEFNLPGISHFADGRRKVLAHYDLTAFGRVQARAPQTETIIADAIQIEDLQVQAGPELHGLHLLATGILDEAAVARTVREPAGVDFNENRESDRFPFVVTRGNGSTVSVWIDANRDGTFTDSSREELTDFNTSGRSLNMVHTAESQGAALAVTINSETNLQFHQIRGGHGTSCASIVAGNKYISGRIDGMAPGAHLLSYVIDATGRDVYSSSTLLNMFLHARDHGADAISVSWGFATADLAAAQTFAQVLDREVAARGIVMGFAAGNSGPGSFSTASQDYIPHLGYGLGAAVTEMQARNVYKWIGISGDHVIHYSSVGPTRNGRGVPDLVSPLMTLVRGRNDGKPGQYAPFGGTSSATPAFIGSVSALLSVLKAHDLPIDTALLKVALLSSARALTNEPAARQGAGMVNVNAAYDRYVTLIREATQAHQDTASDQNPGVFRPAYNLRATVTIGNRGPSKMEGLILRTPARLAQVNLTLETSSLSPKASPDFAETLRIEHTAPWLETPDIVTVQWAGGAFPVAVATEFIKQPGLYQDEIRLIDSSGDLRARIPVHVDVPRVFTAAGRGAADSSVSWQGTLEPFSVKRLPIQIDEGATVLSLNTAVLSNNPDSNASVMVSIFDAMGSQVRSTRTQISGPVSTTHVDLEALPVGRYEVQIFQIPGTMPEALSVTFGLQRSGFRLLSSLKNDGTVDLFVANERGIAIDAAELIISGREYTVSLQPAASDAFPAFKGTWLPAPDEAKQIWRMALGQSRIDRATLPFLDLAVAFGDATSGAPLYWDWFPVNSSDALRFSPIGIDSEVGSPILIEAYPNVGNWDLLIEHPPLAWIRSELLDKKRLHMQRPNEQEPTGDLLLRGVHMDIGSFTQGRMYGQLLLRQQGNTVATLPIELTAEYP
jgi:subtilisin family serine protease